MPAFKSKIDIQSADFHNNTENMGKLVDDLQETLQFPNAFSVIMKVSRLNIYF